MSVANVIPRFVCLQHCPFLPELFNRKPQSSGFGLTSAGAYVFSGNVASVPRLRLVNQSLLSQAPAYKGGSY